MDNKKERNKKKKVLVRTYAVFGKKGINHSKHAPFVCVWGGGEGVGEHIISKPLETHVSSHPSSSVCEKNKLKTNAYEYR